MIFEHILTWFRDMVIDVLASIPLPGVPEWAAAAGSTIGVVLGWVAPLCAWVPFDLAATVLMSVLAVWAICTAAAVIRQLLSAITPGGFGGGSS